MQVLGYVPYNATVVPKGARKPRRSVLFEPVVYDIPEIAQADMLADALVMTDGHGAKKTLSGWSGRLWRRRPQPDPERLAADLRNPFAPDAVERIDVFYDMSRNPGRDQLYVPDPDVRITERFPGKILGGDGPAARRRAERAARRFVLVDGQAWTTAPDPLWALAYTGARWELTASFHADARYGAHLFRADRLVDARAFAATLTDAVPHLVGSFERVLPEFLDRDDLSNFVASRAAHALIVLRELSQHLPPETLLAWQRAFRIVDDANPAMHRRADEPLPDGSLIDPVVSAIEACREALKSADLPDSAEHRLDTIRRDELDPFLNRAAFEMSRRPAAALAVEDEVALGAAARG